MIQNIGLNAGKSECWAKLRVMSHMKQIQSTAYMLISYNLCNEYWNEMY